MKFVISLFNQPAIIIGLITLIGLFCLKKPFSDIVQGTFKTILGFTILGAGGGVIAGVLMDTFIPAFQNAFQMTGVVPSDEAIIGPIQNQFGSDVAIILGLGFAANIILARFSKFKYIFLTGHMALFMAGLITVVLRTLNFYGIELIILGSVLLGITMVLSPALTQPFVRELTGANDIAIGHNNTVNYALYALIGKWFGDSKKSTEEIKVPEKLKFFRDTSLTLAIIMSIVFTITFLFADENLAYELSGGDNIIIFAIMQAFTFSAGFLIVLQGVRMILAEIVPAFKGISERLVPNAIPALDIPVIYPFAQNAVLIGFLTTTIGATIMMFLLPVFGLPVVLLGDTIFFVGAGGAVLAQKTGGFRGTVIGGLINGVLLQLLPALVLPFLESIGFTGSTFADADFAVLGIVLGLLGETFGKVGIYGFIAVLLMIIFIPNFFKSKSKIDIAG
jgi:ascorbate PTS system EIIC component